MSVKIRLSRVGKTHTPFNRIVAADTRAKRDGRFIEKLGSYDPLKGKVINLNTERFEYWISKGAKPSDTVKRIYNQLKKAIPSA